MPTAAAKNSATIAAGNEMTIGHLVPVVSALMSSRQPDRRADARARCRSTPPMPGEQDRLDEKLPQDVARRGRRRPCGCRSRASAR